ncbi:hypothetical protein METBIDRAFT_42025 [Metschnikowia bicuspidata var. bicuspidata NRRL YB-4993]|uniref:Ubiquitin-activating enzyme E1-like n=1 Tax=Metschnikowia bicuspidata var. bicuspidata NRRL YB-4993 TaxID=869754 RepID=A0A1A0HC73_9ASCO|nr:hypothetical protein METBIDRAFT_42025 [Metschnikowia bicuspidata var. bicuspidata NRRL YB-4993]OBA21590.1 hypothetical protein METBIDRAFT_42025 [Metschnikowia bicuspidata var. bicuspidata NRRL YB-4993]
MVGAGGIGCELLKDLLLSGFGEIHIVDLDTITLSNLNRQFLFRQKDIGKLKSLTVVKAVQSFNYYNAKLVPHHGNIMDPALFPVEWWKQFDFIFNALDNAEARRYVNRTALFLHKPLMESGTTGFDGQIQPIFPFETECYECQQKETPKSYPVCTIRSTPSQPVHCIVWAKEFLFTQLFTSTSENELGAADLRKETDDPKEIERILLEANELSSLKKQVADADFPAKLIQQIFHDDIRKALQLESLWKTRRKPEPLQFHEKYNSDLQNLARNPESANLLVNDTEVWSVLETLYVLVESTGRIQKRLQLGEQEVFFDKDDEDTLNFVAAAANLRCCVFNIERKSKFDIKQIAGNIIPAIATTNAIISGLSNLSSLIYWKKNFSAAAAKVTYISIKENKRATSALVEAPNAKCASCGIVSKGLVAVLEKGFDMPLQGFLDLVKEQYGYSDDVSVIVGKNKLVYDIDFDDNLARSLRDLGVRTSETLLIQDDADEYENLELLVCTGENQQVELPKILLRAKSNSTENTAGHGALSEGELEEIADEVILINDDEQPPSKKRKVDSDIVEIL